MKNSISKLILIATLSQSIFSAAASELIEHQPFRSSIKYSAEDSEYEKHEFPLISPLMVQYFKEMAKKLKKDKKLNLDISLAGIYGGETFNLPLKVESDTIPNEPFTTDYVLSLSPLLSKYLDDLRSRDEPQATIRVSIYLEGVSDHRERVSGFDTIEFS